ncbi:hypothetical protein [Accumulibacter sp.]|nr:hypothetical protein [Accumulibacter sp.]MBN8496668.1 hypothetical protein [Accumulibacter sp.]MBO3716474.1 hypothetical protein [Accumulibacter sp.]
MTVDERFVFDVRVLIDQGLTPEGADAVRGALAHSWESNLCRLASSAISARLRLIAVHRVKDEGGVDAIAWSLFRRLTMDQLNRAKGLSNRGYKQSNRYPRASDLEAPQMAASERFRAEGAAAGFCLPARHGLLRVGFHRSLLGIAGLTAAAWCYRFGLALVPTRIVFYKRAV